MQFFFSDHWAVFRGPAFDTAAHRHHAAQWAFAVDGHIAADLSGGRVVEGAGLFVPPEQEHAFHALADVVMVYWEPEHSAYAAFAAQQQCTDAEILKSPPDWPVSLTPASARQLALDCLGQSPGKGISAEQPDPRILKVQEWIGQRLGRPLDLESAANVAHVSAAHLARLFRTECGTTFRAYVRWRRLLRAVEMALAGTSLTDAAHAAGFADSAHLSRTFREMFGVAPRFLFGPRRLLEIKLVL